MPPPKRKGPAPTEADEQTRYERSRGALIGMAVGEALGVQCFGRNLWAPSLPELANGPYVDMRGGGPFSLRAGQVSWATQQACVLATGLRNLRRYELIDTARAYAAWLPEAFDCPELTRMVFAGIADGGFIEAIGKRTWLDTGRRFFDNAALARCAPIGVLFWNDRNERVKATLLDTGLTHFAPLCQLISAAFNGLVAAAIATPKEHLDGDGILKVLETEISVAASTLAQAQPDWVQTIKDAADFLRDDVKAAQRPDPELYGPDVHLFTGRSHVRLAFRVALWHLFHAETFDSSIIDVVNRGGDATANGAITGALLGAVFGERAINAEWREAVLEGPYGLAGPLNNTYHPRVLVTLAGTVAEPFRE